MNAHTPGPWETYVSPNPIGGRRFACIQPIDGVQRRIADVMLFDEQAEADARLIAAAPDMYEALNGLVGLCALLLANDLPPHVRDALENNHRVVAARDTLAKAETP